MSTYSCYKIAHILFQSRHMIIVMRKSRHIICNRINNYASYLHFSLNLYILLHLFSINLYDKNKSCFLQIVDRIQCNKNSCLHVCKRNSRYFIQSYLLNQNKKHMPHIQAHAFFKQKHVIK